MFIKQEIEFTKQEKNFINIVATGVYLHVHVFISGYMCIPVYGCVYHPCVYLCTFALVYNRAHTESQASELQLNPWSRYLLTSLVTLVTDIIIVLFWTYIILNKQQKRGNI